MKEITLMIPDLDYERLCEMASQTGYSLESEAAFLLLTGIDVRIGSCRSSGKERDL